MTETIRLEPHDPIPSGPGRQVVVMRRFREDDPAHTEVRIILTGAPEQVTRPRHPDGRAMDIDDAVDAARAVAESEGLSKVFVIDRSGGPREADILRRGGDHSVHGDALVDTDGENGVRGPDMRDIAHPDDATGAGGNAP